MEMRHIIRHLIYVSILQADSYEFLIANISFTSCSIIFSIVTNVELVPQIVIETEADR